MEEDLITSLYPPPPPYFKTFTDANLEAAEKHRFFTPPKPPAGDTYRSFGNVWHFKDEIPLLGEMGMVQLYDDKTTLKSVERVAELKRLLKALLLNFLELVAILRTSAEDFALKVENIRTVIVNIHHLLNEYRPHQSRESLILLLEKQIEERESANIGLTTADVSATISRIARLILSNPNDGLVADGNTNNRSANETTTEGLSAKDHGVDRGLEETPTPFGSTTTDLLREQRRSIVRKLARECL